MTIGLLKLNKVLADSGETESFSAGDVLFARGDPGRVMYVVLEGTVNLLLGDHLLDACEHGDIFGEMALIGTEPRTATAVASTDVAVAVVDESRFLSLVDEMPFFALHVMRILVDRMHRIMAQSEP